MEILMIQPSPVVDGFLPGGGERTQRPYPFYVDRYGGIANQEFWQGDPARVVGFAKKLHDREVDLFWSSFEYTPETAARLVNMYLVVEDRDGDYATFPTAIESASFISVRAA